MIPFTAAMGSGHNWHLAVVALWALHKGERPNQRGGLIVRQTVCSMFGPSFWGISRGDCVCLLTMSRQVWTFPDLMIRSVCTKNCLIHGLESICAGFNKCKSAVKHFDASLGDEQASRDKTLRLKSAHLQQSEPVLRSTAIQLKSRSSSSWCPNGD